MNRRGFLLSMGAVLGLRVRVCQVGRKPLDIRNWCAWLPKRKYDKDEPWLLKRAVWSHLTGYKVVDGYPDYKLYWLTDEAMTALGKAETQLGIKG